ncbi:MAG: hypothetical protein F4Z49_02245 [Gemmatimonadetes bacterium]|nr:hypothetical protein [Gemmatimonadota bacterium]
MLAVRRMIVGTRSQVPTPCQIKRCNKDNAAMASPAQVQRFIQVSGTSHFNILWMIRPDREFLSVSPFMSGIS